MHKKKEGNREDAMGEREEKERSDPHTVRAKTIQNKAHANGEKLRYTKRKQKSVKANNSAKCW